MLEIRNIGKRFGNVPALDKVSLLLKPGAVYSILGPGGAGKTTLLDIISGFQKADEGKIIFNKKRIERLQPWEIAKLGIARTFQMPRIFKNISAGENLEIAGKMPNAKEKSMEILELLGIYDEKDKPAGKLSYASQKLVEMGRALMLEPELMLLDEPFSGVNEAIAIRITEIIKELRNKGKGFVIAEDSAERALGISELVLVLSGGKEIAEGTPDEIKINPKVGEIYAL